VWLTIRRQSAVAADAKRSNVKEVELAPHKRSHRLSHKTAVAPDQASAGPAPPIQAFQTSNDMLQQPPPAYYSHSPAPLMGTMVQPPPYSQPYPQPYFHPHVYPPPSAPAEPWQPGLATVSASENANPEGQSSTGVDGEGKPGVQTDQRAAPLAVPRPSGSKGHKSRKAKGSGHGRSATAALPPVKLRHSRRPQPEAATPEPN
jgi:hypothetical protein